MRDRQTDRQTNKQTNRQTDFRLVDSPPLLGFGTFPHGPKNVVVGLVPSVKSETFSQAEYTLNIIRICICQMAIGLERRWGGL